jgi:hypothetical protein
MILEIDQLHKWEWSHHNCYDMSNVRSVLCDPFENDNLKNRII